jgi:hypothetical protein
MESKKPLFILSYGGGVNSSALFFYILEKGLPLDWVIFADTGEEKESAYDAVERMSAICEKKGIAFKTVKSEYGRLVDYYTKVRAVPSMQKSDCSDKFKKAVIRKFLRTTYGKKQKFVMYLGMAYDEATRMKDSDVQYITNSYPFIDDRIDRKGNLAILQRYSFKAEKSGCKGCLWQKKSDFLRLAKDEPAEFERWQRMEENGRRYPSITLTQRFKLASIKKEAKEQMTLTAYEPEEERPCNSYGYCMN